MGKQQALAPMASSAVAPQPMASVSLPGQSPSSQQAQLGRRAFARTYAENRVPALALILSLVIVGLGQFYNGDIKKGFLMLGGAVLGGLISFSFLWWVFAIWSAIDAYRIASRAIPLWT
jgi:TM2 domain-containing membrane protein YozV